MQRGLGFFETYDVGADGMEEQVGERARVVEMVADAEHVCGGQVGVLWRTDGRGRVVEVPSGVPLGIEPP